MDWVTARCRHFLASPGHFYLRLPRNFSAVYSVHNCMTRQQVLDLYFLDARHKLIDLAAFLDRADRATGQDDFRMQAFRVALSKLDGKSKNKAKQVLLTFSDLTLRPVSMAEGKGACGAWPKIKGSRH